MPKDPIDGIDPKLVLVELEKQCAADSDRWFPQTKADIAFLSLAICGEAGELANIVKKCARGSLDPNTSQVRHDLAMELTDVLIYVLMTAAALRINLYESYKVKRQENERRFSVNGGAGVH